MNWFLVNLLPISIVGGVIVILSFTRFVKPNWTAFCIGGLILLAVLAGGIYVKVSPPGGEQTESVEIDEHHEGALQTPHGDRLQADWDSDARIPNWPVAETLAVMSDIAYMPPVDAKRKFLDLGFSEFMPIVQGSMIGYVVSDADSTVIVFRGTDFRELSDWLSNVDTTPIDTPHGKIHHGFHDAYHRGGGDHYISLGAQINSILSERDPKHLWVTGHSLGGALALVCAYDLEENQYRRIDGLITFGQPLLLRQNLANYLDNHFIGRYARFAVGEDIVTRIVPGHSYCGSLVHFTDHGVKRSKPKRLLMSFSGTEVSDSLDGENEIEPMTEEEFQELQDSLRARPEDPEMIDTHPVMKTQLPMIEDHSMSLYIEKIRGLFR